MPRGAQEPRAAAHSSRLPLVVLLGAAVLSVGLLGSLPGEGSHLPLTAVMAALLPLQLAALFYVFRRP